MTARRPRSSIERRAAAAVLVLAATLSVAACGATPGSPSAAPVSPQPSAVPSSSPGGTGPSTPLPAGAFSFDLPAGWRTVPVTGSHDAIIAAVRAQSPAVADSLAARLGNLAKTTTYVAFDASPATIAKGDLVTLIVTEVALPTDVTLDTFANTIKSQVDQLVETTVPLRGFLVTAGQARSIAYMAPLTRPDGQPGDLAVTQVFYVLPGRGYVITFAVPPNRANDYAQTIADIATSFTIRN